MHKKRHTPKLIIFLLLISTHCFSQKIQTYNGDYTLKEVNITGNAKYTFYEDDSYQRIYNGEFAFSSVSGGSTNQQSTTVNINGGFKNNKRDGAWKIKVHFGFPYNADWDLTVNYKNGVPDGIWNCKFYKGADVLISDRREFKMGIMVGIWEYESSKDNAKLIMKSDEYGYIKEYELTIAGIQQTIRKYDLGYLILDVKKNLQTGASNVSKLDDPQKMEALSEIKRLSQNYPDSLLDIEFKLIKKSMEADLKQGFFKTYDYTFIEGVRGAELLENGNQFQGLFISDLIAQKTRNQLAKEAEEKKKEEERIKYEEKQKRLEQQSRIERDIKDVDSSLNETLLNELKENTKKFLERCVREHYTKQFEIKFFGSLVWSSKELKGLNSNVELIDTETPYLYNILNVNGTDISSAPKFFKDIFKTDKLANIKMEFEDEKIIITPKFNYIQMKLLYIASEAYVKVSKDKELTWDEVITTSSKKAIAEKVQLLEKGKYKIAYQIGVLDNEIVETDIQILEK